MARVPATRLSLEYLRLQGCIVDVCEKIVPSKPFPKKHDLFNLFDIVAIEDRHNGSSLRFVQTTSATNRSSRRKKMIENAKVMYALQSCKEVSVELHSWKKVKGKYEVKVERCHIDYPGGGLPDVIHFVVFACPTMAQLRAKEKETQAGKERAKRSSLGSRSQG